METDASPRDTGSSEARGTLRSSGEIARDEISSTGPVGSAVEILFCGERIIIGHKGQCLVRVARAPLGMAKNEHKDHDSIGFF